RRKHNELKQSPFYTATLLKATKWKMVPSKLQRCAFLQAVFGVNKSKFDIHMIFYQVFYSYYFLFNDKRSIFMASDKRAYNLSSFISREELRDRFLVPL
ncbi:hypothetical protein VIGAN_04241200, partial [Vigna angularis var. angularis]